MSNIKDASLWPSGRDKIEWVRSYMPLLSTIEEEFKKTQPFVGLKISMSIHLEAKTANLAKILRAGGAEVRVTGCNPLSTQDDVAAALVHEGFEVNAIHGTDEEGYTRDLINTISFSPDLLIDDGGDLMSLLHGEYREYGKNLIGGCEETTTGVHRLIAREKAGLLDYTMIDVNDADCKHLFDNRYGTGQSTLDGCIEAVPVIHPPEWCVRYDDTAPRWLRKSPGSDHWDSCIQMDIPDQKTLFRHSPGGHKMPSQSSIDDRAALYPEAQGKDVCRVLPRHSDLQNL